VDRLIGAGQPLKMRKVEVYKQGGNKQPWKITAIEEHNGQANPLVQYDSITIKSNTAFARKLKVPVGKDVFIIVDDGSVKSSTENPLVPQLVRLSNFGGGVPLRLLIDSATKTVTVREETAEEREKQKKADEEAKARAEEERKRKRGAVTHKEEQGIVVHTGQASAEPRAIIHTAGQTVATVAQGSAEQAPKEEAAKEQQKRDLEVKRQEQEKERRIDKTKKELAKAQEALTLAEDPKAMTVKDKQEARGLLIQSYAEATPPKDSSHIVQGKASVAEFLEAVRLLIVERKQKVEELKASLDRIQKADVSTF
jgi:hypothetical protein